MHEIFINSTDSFFQLIRINDPDLILFVGEALVGNEAVDQLSKFNQALADYSSQENPRLIDGILLTKFDTIDDKVCRGLVNNSTNENCCRKKQMESKIFFSV